MTTSPQQPQREIQVKAPTGVPTVYVEGVSQMLIGFPNSRLLLHSFSERDATNPDAPERRTIACEIVIPTPGLIEMAQLVINSIAQNKEALSSVRAEWVEKLDALTKSLVQIETPVQTVVKHPVSAKH